MIHIIGKVWNRLKIDFLAAYKHHIMHICTFLTCPPQPLTAKELHDPLKRECSSSERHGTG
jgi:hypothetical protein